MSRYKKLDKEKEEEPVVEPQESVNTSDIVNSDFESDIYKNLTKIKWLCIFMIITSPIIPIISWFVDPYHFVFYQFLIIFGLQIYVAILGIRAGKADHYNRIVYFRKMLNTFYLFFIILLLANETLAVIVSSSINYNDCGSFTNYKVCKDRRGMMTTQMVTIIFSPFFVFSVWIFYRYIINIVDVCKIGITRRRI